MEQFLLKEVSTDNAVVRGVIAIETVAMMNSSTAVGQMLAECGCVGLIVHGARGDMGRLHSQAVPRAFPVVRGHFAGSAGTLSQQ